MKTLCTVICLVILTLSHHIAYPQQPLAQQVSAIFEQHCLDCHGEFGSYSDVLTIKHTNLIEDRSVLPRQPDASELYLRLLGDTDSGSQMPLGQEPLDPEKIATIRRWIEAGAPDWEAIPKPERRFITTEAMLKAIDMHVTSLTAFDRAFARYFTLTHLYNAGASDDNLRAYRNALSKLVNSLSWGSEVIKPTPIDPEETIFYIDLRHYEWDIKSDKWYKIEQAYPYGVQLNSSTYKTLCQETDCELPFIRADWFIATASLPPLYHEILDLPKTDKQLETQLEVNVAENLKNAPGVRVWRAGFNESGVSINNRVVERHKSRDYNTAIEAYPYFADAYYNRGTAYLDLDEIDKAIENLNTAIELNPDDADAHSNRGKAYWIKGAVSKAIENYNVAIRLNSNDAELYNNRGTAYIDKEDFDKAIED